MKKACAAALVLLACLGCRTVPPYVPPQSGPVATLVFSGKMFDDAGAGFGIEEKEGCGPHHRVQEPEREDQDVRIPIPASKRVFVSAGYVPRKCYGAASFVPEPGESYVLSNWFCRMVIKNERTGQAQPLERAATSTWDGKSVCRVP